MLVLQVAELFINKNQSSNVVCNFTLPRPVIVTHTQAIDMVLKQKEKQLIVITGID